MAASSTSWKKGTSGNPGGRAKSTVTVEINGELVERSITELAREFTVEGLEILMAIARDPKAPTAARVSAVVNIHDRGWGKPAQMITGDPEQPITVAGVTLDQVLDARKRIVDEC